MRKIDFLFVYEVKNRELENICLLAYELRRRGYSVAFIETWHTIHHAFEKYDARVVVSFAMYNDGQVHFLFNYANSPKKIINLQWEQIYSIAEEEADNALYHICGQAVHAVHISWGDYNYNKLTEKFNILPRNVFKGGHVGFDFFKPNLKGYYLSKEEVCRKYDLNKEKKLVLFVSSFNFNELPKSEIESELYQKLAFPAEQFQSISIESRKIILRWLREILPSMDNIIFIYRPHPAEVGNEELYNMENTLNNFRVIREESVKQWFLISDKIYNWYSTSMAEILSAKAKYEMIRPVPIPYLADIKFFWGCNAVATQEDLVHSLNNIDTCVHKIDESIIHDYYDFSEDYSYIKICDKFIEVYNNDKYKYDFHLKKNSRFSRALNKDLLVCYDTLRRFLKDRIAKIGLKHYMVRKILENRKGLKEYMDNYDFVESMSNNNYSSSDTIEKVIKKIETVINNNKT